MAVQVTSAVWHGIGVHVAPDAMPRPPCQLLDLDVVAERDEPHGRGRGQAGLASAERQRRSARVGGRVDAIAGAEFRAIGEGGRDAVARQGRAHCVGDAGGQRSREERPAIERHDGDHDRRGDRKHRGPALGEASRAWGERRPRRGAVRRTTVGRSVWIGSSTQRARERVRSGAACGAAGGTATTGDATGYVASSDARRFAAKARDAAGAVRSAARAPAADSSSARASSSGSGRPSGNGIRRSSSGHIDRLRGEFGADRAQGAVMAHGEGRRRAAEDRAQLVGPEAVEVAQDEEPAMRRRHPRERVAQDVAIQRRGQRALGAIVAHGRLVAAIGPTVRGAPAHGDGPAGSTDVVHDGVRRDAIQPAAERLVAEVAASDGRQARARTSRP